MRPKITERHSNCGEHKVLSVNFVLLLILSLKDHLMVAATKVELDFLIAPISGISAERFEYE